MRHTVFLVSEIEGNVDMPQETGRGMLADPVLDATYHCSPKFMIYKEIFQLHLTTL